MLLNVAYLLDNGVLSRRPIPYSGFIEALKSKWWWRLLLGWTRFHYLSLKKSYPGRSSPSMLKTSQSTAQCQCHIPRSSLHLAINFLKSWLTMSKHFQKDSILASISNLFAKCKVQSRSWNGALFHKVSTRFFQSVIIRVYTSCYRRGSSTP